ncbi:hypothetical protein [Caulobacter segnis]|uniref:Uncharacterized protein n=1 Tax=Caulobacter segnis TaxID=88688 RepID=A0A2W5X5J2_9CAUL|nr:hypothetical protein [Caulobacter segnis]PZR36064.1 MAG: hypothetical protein DI526_04660 [Caulobacter segnis]
MIRPNLPVDRPQTTRFFGHFDKRLGILNRPSGRVEISLSSPAVAFKTPEQVLEFATALLAAADEWASRPQSPTQNG